MRNMTHLVVILAQDSIKILHYLSIHRAIHKTSFNSLLLTNYAESSSWFKHTCEHFYVFFVVILALMTLDVSFHLATSVAAIDGM
jgi:hypothetical protein